MTEKEFQGQVVDLFEDLGYLVYHTHDARRSAAGYPDLTMVNKRKKRVIFAELKSEQGKRTPDQVVWGMALDATPGVEYYLWYPRDWDKIIEVAQNGPDHTRGR